MDPQQLGRLLDEPREGIVWLRTWGLPDPAIAHSRLVQIASSGLTLDLLADWCRQLPGYLSEAMDAQLAIERLADFVSQSRNPLALGTLAQREPAALRTLVRLLGSRGWIGRHLVRDPEAFDLLRISEGRPTSRDRLVDELTAEVGGLTERRAVVTSLRRFQQREWLRIAYGRMMGQQSVDEAGEQLAFVADAVVEAAVRAAWRLAGTRHHPQLDTRQPAVPCAVIALGEWGGEAGGYDRRLPMFVVYDSAHPANAALPARQALWESLISEVALLVSDPDPAGPGYELEWSMRFGVADRAHVLPADEALAYFDTLGRTWERHALVKARPAAGDREFGRRFLARLQPWLYRRYLNRADLTELKALKRRLERQTRGTEDEPDAVARARRAARDIDFLVAFLQLLYGGAHHTLRVTRTLDALNALVDVGCLESSERDTLCRAARTCRHLTHRWQTLADPGADSELADNGVRPAIYAGPSHTDPAAEPPESAPSTLLDEACRTCERLLADAFPDEPPVRPETDLVVDPAPDPRFIEQTLAPYGFRDHLEAHRALVSLAEEKIAFLSTRRCRHFLASIAPQLLEAVASTPDPDATLTQLRRVSDSLGGKGVLWELFRVHPPTLTLYVRMCATSPYLTSILTTQPGMLDELMDTLVLNRLPPLGKLRSTLSEWARHADDLEPILHSFKSSQHLAAGVRDILGKEDIQNTMAFLADVAECCLGAIIESHFHQLADRWGTPMRTGAGRSEQPCDLVVLALGKLGSREPNYHSALDLAFVFEADGQTRHRRTAEGTSNQHFFNELAQRVLHQTARWSPWGRLYEVGSRLAAEGPQGVYALSLEDFRERLASEPVPLAKRLLFSNTRALTGATSAQSAVMQVVRHAVAGHHWRPTDTACLRDMRIELQNGAGPNNLKRSPGGTLDVEFIVHMLRMRYGHQHPQIITSGTIDGLRAAQSAGLLDHEDATKLDKSYRFLRGVEARLRLMNTAARHDLPESPRDLAKLAYLLEVPDPQQLVELCRQSLSENRRRFLRLFDN